LSDLQCAATLLLASVRGEEQARALGTSLLERRVALVYTDGSTTAARTAGLLSERLGVPVRPEPGLAPDGRGVLEGLADLHRGETVLVVAETEVIGRVLGTAGRAIGSADNADDVVELHIDADGWTVSAG
jgi:hypothetical protein